MSATIDEILKRAYIWVFENVPGRGFGTNWDYTVLPEELRGNPETEDKPWMATVGPYVLDSQRLEKVEMAGRYEKWETIDQILKNIYPDFPKYVNNKQVYPNYIVISHGKFPVGELFVISQHVYSEKGDEFGRPGIAYVKTILLGDGDYKVMLEQVKTNPRIARKVFDSIAPDLAKKCTLPEESNRPIIIIHAERARI